MESAVQFGAGNIGRGFIAQLFCESGLETVFVDVSELLVGALNDRHAYTIDIVGPSRDRVPISNVRAIDGRDVTAVAEAIAGSAIVSTAVGANILKHIAPTLAEGLALRYRRGALPLNVLICENLHDAGPILRDLVAAHLPVDDRDAILTNTGFVQAVVSRMVPLQEPDADDPLAIRVEAYKRLPVDANAVVEPFPTIAGVEPVSSFEAYVERKLYTHNCAHATLGYLGWFAGYTYAWEALDDPEIRSDLNRVLAETGEALIRKHGFKREDHGSHVADLIDRFRNKDLGDTCFRLGRDPARKLAADDRLTGAARLCESQDVTPHALPKVIAAAFRFRPPDDPGAVEVHVEITRSGFDGALLRYAGIEPDSPLGMAVRDEYEALAGRR